MNKTFLYEWNFNLWIFLSVVILICFFQLLSGFKYRKNTSCFFTSIFLFLLVTCSPLHYLGMYCYFSAHMVAHVILLLICGPLLVISIPSIANPRISKIINAISAFFSKRSVLAWLSGVGIMWLLHMPAIFDSTFVNKRDIFSIGLLLHSGSMLLAGMLFSWPLFGPVPRYRIHPLAGVVYLFTACISCSLLGLLITFAPLTTYQHYMVMGASLNKVKPFDISASADQQAAGLIMWVPCCFVYLAGCIYLLRQWFLADEVKPNDKIITLNKINVYE